MLAWQGQDPAFNSWYQKQANQQTKTSHSNICLKNKKTQITCAPYVHHHCTKFWVLLYVSLSWAPSRQGRLQLIGNYRPTMKLCSAWHKPVPPFSASLVPQIVPSTGDSSLRTARDSSLSLALPIHSDGHHTLYWAPSSFFLTPEDALNPP